MAKTDGVVSPEFEALLEYIDRSRGFDFTGYKRPGLQRRVLRRMEVVGVPSFPAYVDYLEVHPDEFTHLFNTIVVGNGRGTAGMLDDRAEKHLEADSAHNLIGDPRSAGRARRA